MLGFLKVRDQLKDSLPKRNEELEVHERLFAANDLAAWMSGFVPECPDQRLNPQKLGIEVCTIFPGKTIGVQVKRSGRKIEARPIRALLGG